MKRTIIFYGLAMALLVFLLKVLEYRFFMQSLRVEFYVGLIALLFTALGIWAGLKLNQRKTVLAAAAQYTPDPDKVRALGLTTREMEVLELMAAGFSNQEIADKLFVSLPTVKTHTANVYLKLNVRRRTQAVSAARQMGLIP